MTAARREGLSNPCDSAAPVAGCWVAYRASTSDIHCGKAPPVPARLAVPRRRAQPGRDQPPRSPQQGGACSPRRNRGWHDRDPRPTRHGQDTPDITKGVLTFYAANVPAAQLRDKPFPRRVRRGDVLSRDRLAANQSGQRDGALAGLCQPRPAFDSFGMGLLSFRLGCGSRADRQHHLWRRRWRARSMLSRRPRRYPPAVSPWGRWPRRRGSALRRSSGEHASPHCPPQVHITQLCTNRRPWRSSPINRP